MTPWQTQFEQNLKQLATLELHRRKVQSSSLSQYVTPFKQDDFQLYLKKFIEVTPGLHAIYDQGLESEIFNACDTLYRFPILVEHVALMSKLLPKTYASSVFSALAAFVIAKTLNHEQKSLEIAFLAGLLHDIGFLYYPTTPDYNHLDEASISDAAIRAHGPVGAGVIRRIDNAPEGLADIIRDHHEHFNGTGYPNHKPADQLHPLVFVINVTDILVRSTGEYAIYPNHCHQLSRLVLQLNQEQIPDDVYRTAIKLTLHKTDCNEAPDVLPDVEELLAQRLTICTAMAALSSTLKLLQKHQAFDISRAAARINRQLQATFQQMGIEHKEYERWLIKQTHVSSIELLNCHVIQNEICHQLARFYTSLTEANKKLSTLEVSLKTQVIDLLNATELPALVMAAVQVPVANNDIPLTQKMKQQG